MAVTLVGSRQASATTIAMPTGYAADDLLIIVYMKSAGGSAITPPAGWTSLWTNVNGPRIGVAYKIAAASTGETSGTWTGANALISVCLRGVDTSDPFGSSDENSDTSSTVTYGTILALEKTHGPSKIFAVVGVGSSTLAAETEATNFDLLQNVAISSAEIAAFITPAGWSTTNFSSTTAALGGSDDWISYAVEVKVALAVIVGTAAISEAADTVAGVANIKLFASAEITEATDTLGTTASLLIVGSASLTEANDTVEGVAATQLLGALAATEANDTLETATLLGGATLDIVEQGDSVGATSQLAITGVYAATEDDDVGLLVSGGITQGVFSAIEAGDTIITNGIIALSATLSANEEPDTSAINATLRLVGQLAIEEAFDTTNGAGDLDGGVAYIIEADDASGFTAMLLIAATLASSEGDDILAAASQISFKATLALMEADDELAAAGAQLISGFADALEELDTLNGQAALGINGPITVTELNDTLAGLSKVRISATAAITEQPDGSYASSFAGGLKFRWFNGTEYRTVPVYIWSEESEWAIVTLTGG